ncbi:MAG: 7-cyano-7-deazaguanine synthase, partial [Planctomycetota bacterium]
MKNAPTIDTAAAAGQGGAAPGPCRAVVLLSGGLDSATAAAWALAEGFSLAALSVAYGQRHAVELDAARDVARSL